MNILIVEDERLIAESLQNGLQKIPFVRIIDSAESFDVAYQKAMSDVFDIILVDISLGKSSFSGLDLCAALRKANRNLPIVIITAYHSINFLEQAFEMGVNDYITKPFRIQEVQVRVKRWFFPHMAVQVPSHNELLSYGELSYSTDAHLFFWAGEKIPLTKKNKMLLQIFFQYRGQMLVKNFLQAKLWGDLDDAPSHRNLRANIQILRNALPKPCSLWIKTIRGEGYLFTMGS